MPVDLPHAVALATASPEATLLVGVEPVASVAGAPSQPANRRNSIVGRRQLPPVVPVGAACRPTWRRALVGQNGMSLRAQLVSVRLDQVQSMRAAPALGSTVAGCGLNSTDGRASDPAQRHAPPKFHIGPLCGKRGLRPSADPDANWIANG